MQPKIVSIIEPLFELVKGDSSRIILLKNNTIILLKENENYRDKMKIFDDFNQLEKGSKLINLTLHFFRSYSTQLFIHPGMEDIGLLHMVKKKEPFDLVNCLAVALDNFQKDMLFDEVVFDSAKDDIRDYQPTMYLFVNKDLKMGLGKSCGQVGHAVGCLVEELVLAEPQDQCYIDWRETSMKKVVLKATEDQLNELSKDAQEIDSLGTGSCVKVHDAGKTQISKNSFTVLGFRPMYQKDVPNQFATFSLL